MITADTKDLCKGWITPFIYFKDCFKYKVGQSSAGGGRAKNLCLFTWNVTSVSSYFLLREILFTDGAVTTRLYAALLFSRWIYYCREIFLLSCFPSSLSWGSLSPPCGMVLLKIHPVARHKNSSSINFTDWFAVVFFKSQPRLGKVDRNAWCVSRNGDL